MAWCNDSDSISSNGRTTMGESSPLSNQGNDFGAESMRLWAPPWGVDVHKDDEKEKRENKTTEEGLRIQDGCCCWWR